MDGTTVPPDQWCGWSGGAGAGLKQTVNQSQEQEGWHF